MTPAEALACLRAEIGEAVIVERSFDSEQRPWAALQVAVEAIADINTYTVCAASVHISREALVACAQALKGEQP